MHLKKGPLPVLTTGCTQGWLPVYLRLSAEIASAREAGEIEPNGCLLSTIDFQRVGNKRLGLPNIPSLLCFAK